MSILVEVLEGTQPETGCNCSGCGSSAGCGSARDIPAETNKLADELSSYGDKVEVKYVNVDKEGSDNYPNLDRILQMGYPYPITIINGEPKFAGGIMADEVKKIIDGIMSE
jgi:disulfide oxidoreductase YuzD